MSHYALIKDGVVENIVACSGEREYYCFRLYWGALQEIRKASNAVMTKPPDRIPPTIPVKTSVLLIRSVSKTHSFKKRTIGFVRP